MEILQTRTSLALALPLIAAAAFGQSAATPKAFEVASIKAVVVDGENEGSRAVPKTSPNSVIVTNMPLSAIVRWAYDVKDYQVTGPAWINSQYYDIYAKTAGPASYAELQAMTRALLVERIKLVSHREVKNLPIFEMTIAKGGHKLTASSGEGESSLKRPNNVTINAKSASMPQFADLMSRRLRAPVLDKTGLQGTFDFVLDLASYLQPDANGRLSLERVPPEDREAITEMGVQQQLGLKLTPTKGPIERIVIEQAEKLPANN